MRKLQIKTTKKDLIFKVPLQTTRYDPFQDKEYGSMDNVAACIEHTNSKDNGNDFDLRMGFCYVIDMAYKGKDDQYTDLFFEVDWMTEKQFRKLVEELKLSLIEEWI